MTRRRRRTEEERVALLAAALARPDASWDELLTAVAYWPEDQHPERGVATLEAAASRFDAYTRSPSAAVLRELSRGVVGPYLRLIRWIDLRPLWEVRRRDLLFRRVVLEGGARELHGFETRYDHGIGHFETLTRHVHGLRYLYVGMSGIGSPELRALAEAPSSATLEHLSLHNNVIEDDGAQAMLESPHLVGLRYINLYGNRLSERMVERLHAAPQWRDAWIIAHRQGCYY
ncbi:MAG: hypothetical protein KC636_16110 [Myxococcales bacterium]|nr:hypothetical protein [Myxococcales bacterium]